VVGSGSQTGFEEQVGGREGREGRKRKGERTNLDESTDDSERGQTEVLERTGFAGCVEEGVEEEGDVGCGEEGKEGRSELRVEETREKAKERED